MLGVSQKNKVRKKEVMERTTLHQLELIIRKRMIEVVLAHLADKRW